MSNDRRGRIAHFLTSESFLSLYLPAFTLALGTGIAAPALPVYAKSFDISFGVASLVVIVHLFGAVAATIPTGFLIDRVGRRKILLLGPILTAASSVLTATAGSFPELLVYRFVGGWALGMWSLARLAIITDTGGDRRGRLITAQVGFDSAGRLVGPVMGGLIAAASDVRVPFLVHAGLALLAIAPSFKLIRETTPTGRSGGRMASASAAGSTTWVKEVLIFPIVLLCIVQTLVALTRGSIHSGTFDLYAVYAYEIGPDVLGLIAATVTAVSLPITFLAGHLMDRFGRKATIVPGFALLGVALALLAVTAYAGLSLMVYVFVLIAVHLTMAVTHGSMQALASDVAPPNARGKFFGIWRLVGEGGTFLSPVIFALLAQFSGFPASFAFMSVTGFGAAFLTLFFVTETLHSRSAESRALPSRPFRPEHVEGRGGGRRVLRQAQHERGVDSPS